MSALLKKKARREGLRKIFKTTFDEATSYLSEDENDKAKLIGFKKTLQSLVGQLSISDDDILKSLDSEEVEADVIESMQIVNPVNELEANIDLKIEELSVIKELPPSSVSSSATSNMCRLPKMELPVFSGNPLKWQGFWDQFTVSIHENDRISDIDRFNFLKKYLSGDALSAVSGLNLNAENYKEAVAILKERYGNEQILISAHMESLLEIEKIKSKNNIKGLRELYNHIESCVRNLRSLKLETKGYGSLLIPLLKRKMPDDLTLLISRKFGATVWTFDQVMNFFNEELIAQENCAVNLSSASFSEKSSASGGYTAMGLHVQNSKKNCVFCKKDSHPSSRCKTITNNSSRRSLLRKEQRCFLCLGQDHLLKDCTSEYRCRKCNGGKHHISICEGEKKETVTAFSL